MYVIQGAALPTHLCDKLDKINKDFLWGTKQEWKRMHLVGWSKITKAKEEEGLGIHATRARNLALLAKLNWRLYMEKDALWAKVILNKYCSQTRSNSKDPDKLPCSITWKAMKQGFPIFAKEICWNADRSLKLNFWMDPWIKGDTMRELIEGPLQYNEDKLTIEEMFKDGCWNWEKLYFVRPSTIKEKINAIPIPLFGESKDFISWKCTSNGEFSMASAYKLAKPDENQNLKFLGGWIWELDTAPKIQHFLWLCNHRSVPVRETIAARGVVCDTICPVCKNAEESLSHALRECPFAMDFWRNIKTPMTLQVSFQEELLDWLKSNCLCDPNIMVNGYPWRIQFPFAVWYLWKHRNRVVFENTILNMSLHTYCINQSIEYFYCVGKPQKINTIK